MINQFFKPKTGSKKSQPEEEDEHRMEEESSTKKKALKSTDDKFMTFDEFKESLGTWGKLLSKYTASPKFVSLYNNVREAYHAKPTQCYPPKEQIFNCFVRSSITDIKVVIVGQDPYHQPGQAMGLCFSVNRGVKVPPSLVNIYKCIQQDPDISNFKAPNHGDLTKWADQGVLLLNTVLTVEDSKPNSHQKFGWLDLTNEVIRVIAHELEGIVFLLWGKPAEKKSEIINKSTKNHHILTAVHPSPLSASQGFFECQHFSKCNTILQKLGKKPIDWSLN